MNYSAFFKSTKFRYSIWGGIFGLFFPFGAILFEAIRFSQPITLLFILQCHQDHPLLLLIDTAPIFLGFAWGIIGIQKEKLDSWGINLERCIKETTYEVNSQKEFYKALVQNTPLGIIALDNQFQVTAANKSFENMFGYSESQLIGKNLDKLISNAPQNFEAMKITNRVIGGETIREIGKRKRNDGQLIDVEISGVPIIFQNEQIGILGIYEEITERMRLENAIRISEKKFRAVAETAKDAIITINSKGIITFWNHGAEKIFGYSTKDMYDKAVYQIIPNQFINGHNIGLEKLNTSGLSSILGKTVEISGLKKDGTKVPIQLSLSTWESNEETFYTVIIRDITEQKKIEKAIIHSEANFKSLFNNSPISLWEEDFSEVKIHIDKLLKNGKEELKTYLFNHPEEVKEMVKNIKILQVNFATIKLYGAKNNKELMAGLDKIFTPEAYNTFRDEILFFASGGISYQNEIHQKTLSGKDIYAHLLISIAPGYEETWGKVFVSITDITERKEIEEKYKHMSFHDGLTGLYNRAYFETEMSRLDNSRQFPISIIVFDMNNLKHINDSLGHSSGDQAIISVSSLLSRLFRDEDMVARIGGDEFVVILPGTDRHTMEMIKERIENSTRQMNMNSTKDFFHPISLSMGVATIQKEQNLMEGYKLADKRMYEDKRIQKTKIKLPD